jgi:hypothetical protein
VRSFTRVAALALALLLHVPLPAGATAASTAGDATPNFTESSSCGVYGTRGPLSPSTRIGDRIYGPYADFYGRSYGQVSSSISSWVEPSGRTFQVHRRSLPAFQDAGARIRAAGTGYRVTGGAGWVWRNVAGSRQMSHHAVGNAVDINPSRNPYTDGRLITDMPAAYVAAWRAAGFCWGGDWRFTKDAMHFSWRGPAAVGGRSPRLGPYPPLTGPAVFTRLAMQAPVAIPGGAALWAMSDRRREGPTTSTGLSRPAVSGNCRSPERCRGSARWAYGRRVVRQPVASSPWPMPTGTAGPTCGGSTPGVPPSRPTSTSTPPAFGRVG